MAITNTEIAQKISDLVDKWHLREDEMVNWLAGTVNGGVAFDGKYPLTNVLGVVTQVTCPAQLASSVSSLMSGAAGYATAASNSATAAALSAADAALSATSATSSKNAAAASEASALNSKNTSANHEANCLVYKDAASSSATSAASSEINAATSETNAASSATAAATSASNALTSETNAASSAASISRDTSGGLVGKTLEKLNLYNPARSFVNFIAAYATTASRTWTFQDASGTVALLDVNTLSNRQRLINANFRVNNRNVSGTVTLAAGAYGHNNWKAGASGCTYTFSTSDNVTTINISVGTLLQVIEGIWLQSGTHVLSWSGTSQGRIDGGSYGNSGITGTAVGGNNQTIEFGTGTLALPQYEPGTIPTVFEFRMDEDLLCQRYLPYIELRANSVVGLGTSTSSTTANIIVNFPVPTRVPPTGVILTGGVGSYYLTNSTYGALTCSSVAITYVGLTNAILSVASATGVAAGTLMAATTTVAIYFTGSEL